MQTKTAIDEIRNFLQSDVPGVESDFSETALVKAAETLFTANGQSCPIAFLRHNGKTFMYKRDAITASASASNNS